MKLPWSSCSSSPSSDNKNTSSTSLPSTSDLQDVATKAARNWTNPEVIVPSILLTVVTLGGLRFYKRYLRRIPSIAHIGPNAFRRRSLFGKVTSVGDGDNFRIFHIPGGRLAGWGWFPGRRVPTKREELSGETIHVRIAGVDAPELAHFGRPAQPYGQEALDFLTSYILNRRVRAYLWRRDQYERVVATVYVRRGLFRRDVGLEMLKRGLATVYEAKWGSEFGNKEKKYREAEEKAKAAKVGMWSEGSIWWKWLGVGGKSKPLETPREYKTRMTSEERDSGKK